MGRRRQQGEPERFAVLEAALGDPATPWSQVLTLLAGWPPEHRAGDAVAAVEAVVDRWPAASRGLNRAVERSMLEGHFSPALRLVRVLDLRAHWRLAQQGLLARMIEDGGLRRVLSLSTRHHREDVASLIASRLVGLERLSAGASGVTAEGAAALARSPGLAGLRSLALHGNPIGDEGAGALASSPFLSGLRHLNVFRCSMSPSSLDGLRAAFAGAVVIG